MESTQTIEFYNYATHFFNRNIALEHFLDLAIFQS